MQVELTNRIILSPFAASGVMQQYEARFGVMDLGAGLGEKPNGK